MTKRKLRTLVVLFVVAILLGVYLSHRQKTSVRATTAPVITVDVVKPGIGHAAA